MENGNVRPIGSAGARIVRETLAMAAAAGVPTRPSRWCILRTSPGRTLGLAASLADAGLDVWTPMQIQSRRIPRSKARREIEAPIMPTFVFARERHIDELLAILALPVNPHPAFSIFRPGGRIPLVSDREIAGARAIEEQGRMKKLRAERHIFRTGERVRVPEGSFAGLEGIVEGGDGKFALVTFGNMQVKIATFLLRTDGVQVSPEPTMGAAALAA